MLGCKPHENPMEIVVGYAALEDGTPIEKEQYQ